MNNFIFSQWFIIIIINLAKEKFDIYIYIYTPKYSYKQQILNWCRVFFFFE